MSVKSLRGDTLIEVLFSITIFGLIAVITVNLMNNGIYTAQKSLEITMTRNEIDSQAEALRFIHGNYLAEKDFTGGVTQYRELWEKIVSFSQEPSTDLALSFNNMDSCEVVYDNNSNISINRFGAFIVNTRFIQPTDITTAYETGDISGSAGSETLNEIIVSNTFNSDNDDDILRPTSLFPRVIYRSNNGHVVSQSDDEPPKLKESETLTRVAAAEGIVLTELKPAGGAGLEELFLELTADTQREGNQS